MTNSLQAQADLVFLAFTVWREARGEGALAQLAVAYSILNRVHRPSWWGDDVQSVVFKRWQYSSLTAPNDPQLTTWPQAGDPYWRFCLTQADAAIHDIAPNPVAGADSYFDVSIAPPRWATPNKLVRAIGRLRFYNLDSDHELADAPQ